jgi:hypothetical protein
MRCMQLACLACYRRCYCGCCCELVAVSLLLLLVMQLSKATAVCWLDCEAMKLSKLGKCELLMVKLGMFANTAVFRRCAAIG